MSLLSSWMDLESPESLGVFTSLLARPGERVGVYKSISSIDDLLQRLKVAEVAEIEPVRTKRPQILKIYDIDKGVRSSISSLHLKQLVECSKIDPNVSIHFRYRYGGLYLFLLTCDFDEKVAYSEHTFLAIDKKLKTPWLARIGSFTPVNEVWFQHQYDGRVSTLGKILKVPYLKSISICTQEELNSQDITY